MSSGSEAGTAAPVVSAAGAVVEVVCMTVVVVVDFEAVPEGTFVGDLQHPGTFVGAIAGRTL